MGLWDSLNKKIGNAIENAASKNMSGATKEAYEKEKAENLKTAEEIAKNTVPMISGSYDKAELENLGALLKKIDAVDEENIWIAGFPNYKTNQNAFAANLLSGKKNLKFLASKSGFFYLLKLENGTISSYKGFRKEDVAEVEATGKLLTKSFKVKLKDGTVYTVDVSENKDKIQQIKEKLK